MTLDEALEIAKIMCGDVPFIEYSEALDLLIKYVETMRAVSVPTTDFDGWDDFFADPRYRAMMEGEVVDNGRDQD